MLIAIESFFLIFINKNFLNHKVISDDTNTKKIENKNNSFAILLQSGNAYIETDEFPVTNYQFDSSKSGCVNETGERILDNGQNVLSYDATNRLAILNTDEASYCYLYFNKACKGNGLSLIECSPDGLGTEEEGGLYRYEGEEVNNYVCFGTKSKNTCLGNLDKYMYRIVGIDASGKMKLIKKDALYNKKWHSDASENITWPNSDLYKGLNGLKETDNYFLGTDYIPMEWENVIEEVDWHYGDMGLELSQTSARNLASMELEFPTIKAKIGLMYLHDYAYSLPGGNNCSAEGSYEKCATSWMFLWKTTSFGDRWEWTITRGSYDNKTLKSWIIFSFGYIAVDTASHEIDVRPTFYLKDDQAIVSGIGTINDPYMLSYMTDILHEG